MTFYQELQLNQQGSKALLKASANGREKARHLAIYVFKVLLTLLFCVAFVTLYSTLLGDENSVAGVVVLLAVMVFRQADLGFKASQSVPALLAIFAVMAFGPRLANMVPPLAALFVNMICILSLVILGCHNIIMANHSTFVLGYLVLYGYDVQGEAYGLRLMGLAVGGVITALILYRNHRKRTYKRSFSDVFREFSMDSTRSRWQLRMGLGVPMAMFVGQLLGFERVMWIGFAAMGILQPLYMDLKQRIKSRLPGTVGGCLLFLVLTALLPEQYYSVLGMIGGIGVGFSVTYGWQTVFNALGALSMAMGIYGLGGAVGHRIADNIFAALFAVAFYWLFERMVDWMRQRKDSDGGCAADAA